LDAGHPANCKPIYKHDQHVAPTHVLQALGQAGTVGFGLRPRGTILEHLLAAGIARRVELAVEQLRAFGGRDAGVADQGHSVVPPSFDDVSRQTSSPRGFS
jgi:hypothetical protein